MQLRPASSLLIRSLLYWASLALATFAAAAPEDNGDSVLARIPHIAVILPLQSASFGKAADSVRLGILSASELAPAGAPRVRIYATTEDPQQILSAYQRATSLDAKVVIGPLTRNGVTALAYSGIATVPTLALNAPEGDAPLPRYLYVFGLQIELEARQLAKWAFRQGSRRAYLIVGETSLDTRVAQAFSEEWKHLKGEISGRFGYAAEPALLSKLREQITGSDADMTFLSIDASKARFLRSYLGNTLPIYATSQVFSAASNSLANYDLEGIRFLDMPWLLQPDHPAVISYLRQDTKPRTPDEERFYAVGVDAYRIAIELLRPFEKMEPLDGVTGTITMNDSQQFLRIPVPAQFIQGAARALEAPAGR
jgi:outer membrane PBP1 activator LpoA protein